METYNPDSDTHASVANSQPTQLIKEKTLRYFVATFIFACLAGIATAGLDQAGKYNEVIAIYKFENVLDSGPREINGALFKNAALDEFERGKVLRIRKGDTFEASSDQSLALIPDFSVVAWIRLKPPECCFGIGMRATNENGSVVGRARISVLKNGNISGWFEKAEQERNLPIHVNLWSKDIDVADFKWHHVAFTRYGDIYTLFVDGQVVARKYVDDYVAFFGDRTHILVFGTGLEGPAYVDDLVFLEIGLSVYEVRALKNTGLDAFLQAMPVDPADKVATTWAAVKRRR